MNRFDKELLIAYFDKWETMREKIEKCSMIKKTNKLLSLWN